MATTDLAAVADELYALRPDEFTAARDARAKELRADGDRDLARAVGRLPRPTTAAWAVNLLVRSRPEEVEGLLEVGAALRDAQDTLAKEDLRRLNREQHKVVAAVRRAAAGLARDAGKRLSDAVTQQVEATLRAAMADPDAAAAVRSGLLVRDLESIGFGAVDLEGAVALADAGAAAGTDGAPSGDEGHTAEDGAAADRAAEERSAEDRAAEEAAERRRRERAEAAVARAEARAREAAEAVASSADELAAVEDRRAELEARTGELADEVAELEERLAGLRGELASVEAELTTTTEAERDLRGAHDTATEADAAAARELTEAQDALARLDDD